MGALRHVRRQESTPQARTRVFPHARVSHHPPLTGQLLSWGPGSYQHRLSTHCITVLSSHYQNASTRETSIVQLSCSSTSTQPRSCAEQREQQRCSGAQLPEPHRHCFTSTAINRQCSAAVIVQKDSWEGFTARKSNPRSLFPRDPCWHPDHAAAAAAVVANCIAGLEPCLRDPAGSGMGGVRGGRHSPKGEGETSSTTQHKPSQPPASVESIRRSSLKAPLTPLFDAGLAAV